MRERLEAVISGLPEWLYHNLGGGVLIGVLLVAAPFVISRFVVGASWLQVALAFAIFFGGLFLALLGRSNLFAEALVFTMIFGVFAAWLAVPVIALVLRLANLPSRFL